MISAIVAVDNDWGIGFNGELLESIPNDLKRFKELTTGHVVVMGRKTWDSLPNRPLPNRNNFIISKEKPLILECKAIRFEMEDAIKYIQSTKEDVFIIGGGSVYEQLLFLCDRVYVTKIFKSHKNVDTYFPNLDKMNNWTPACCSAVYDYNNLLYQFWEYDKIS